MTAQPATPKLRRRWLRFSLRTLLVVMLLFGVAFGVLGWMANEARRQRKVVADLREMGAYISFSDEEPSMPELLDTGYCRRVNECLLGNTQFADFTPLAELKNLQQLDLSGTQVADVTPLAELKNLRWLVLIGTQVADVTPLAELKNLTVLYLDNTQVADVTPLAELKNLVGLNLSRTQVADVTPLAELKNLQELYLNRTQVSDEQVNELQQALPDCEIVR